MFFLLTNEDVNFKAEKWDKGNCDIKQVCYNIEF